MSTHKKATPGAVAVGPGRRSGQRTAADLLADMVSLLVLLALGGFALAVSFRHTMQFVQDHGQHERWVVVGTALTVVGLTVQSGLETYRDSRAGRGRGGPAWLLGLAVLAELYANASTAADGLLPRVVAAWPVLVAAAALALWTRRLQHAAEAAEVAGNTVAAMLWDVPNEERAAVAAAVLEHGQEQEEEEEPEPDPDPLAEELAAAGTAKERAALVLAAAPAEELPGPTELGERVGCSKQYAATLLADWKAQPANHPGQLTLAAAAAA